MIVETALLRPALRLLAYFDPATLEACLLVSQRRRPRVVKSRPFYGADTVQEFQNDCDIEIDGEVPVVFTHDDLVPHNILLSPGPNLVVAAIIDWGQSGWYLAYWEYCKAHRVGLNPDYFNEDLGGE
ncbi:hypothetical protein N8T08_000960 [Aspergillus melleus]|uniref:Uncharacterized protein n=1 Tax=Aspergillus melleus TaxID=138277 RepID=A0ACC3BAC4_9EURO|nr:hypothetical protein N8T08_000960 [Aspergillus melleus]